MIPCTFDFTTVSFCGCIVEDDSDGCCRFKNITELFDDALKFFVEEFLALVLDAGHVVEYASVLFAESSGSEPSGNGSLSGDGEECSEDERKEKRCDGRFEFAVESFGNVVKKFEGVWLSCLKHGSPF